MNYETFCESLAKPQPPDTANSLLKALWYDEKGDWDAAHDLAQDIHSPDGSWIHAYLHRKEGDKWNANYWYRQAGRTMPDATLKEEWEQLVRHFL